MSEAEPLPRFVVDAMLGRLARWLRVIGCDTLYPGQAHDRRLLQISHAESRILGEPLSCLIRSDRLDEQIREAADQLALGTDRSRWLSRCLECNGVLASRTREELRGLVPEHVLATQVAFMVCPGCARIYWAGTHVDRMLERLERVLGRAERR
jgi:uncharacterized protein with PIN domain